MTVTTAPDANIAGGTGASPSEVNHTLTGDASLRSMLGNAVPEGTTLRRHHKRRSVGKPAACRTRYGWDSGMSDGPP